MNKIKNKILIVFGTRPEAIKMCPLILKLKNIALFDYKICISGQHKDMVYPIIDFFEVKPDYDLGVMKEAQTLEELTSSILLKVSDVLTKENPDIVLVHGDTTTALAAAMAAFYKKIPVGHVEAGLRTGNLDSPFPEEFNRVFIDRISTIHFAPTIQNAKMLGSEGFDQSISITGNTVIDSLMYTVKDDYIFSDKALNEIDFDIRRCILLTIHRRENIGEPMSEICKAVRYIADENPDIVIICPVHPNPEVKKIVEENLHGKSNILLLKPLNILDMHNLIYRCYFVMTDSGGLQEEAPHFGKPVLVLRNETERPEAVEAGTVRVIGTNYQKVKKETEVLLNDKSEYSKMANAVNPYGDGTASEKIVNILIAYFSNIHTS